MDRSPGSATIGGYAHRLGRGRRQHPGAVRVHGRRGSGVDGDVVVPLVEEVAHLSHRPAGCRVAGHRVLEHRRQPARVVQPGWLLVHDPVEAAHQVLAHVVRRVAGERVVERGAERPDVRGLVGGRPGGHLGREVGRGAGDEAGLGQRRVGLRPGDPEVGQLHRPLGRDQHVGRLDVAVHDPRGVGRRERVGRLTHERCGLVGREGTVALDQRAEGDALDVLHDEPRLVALGHQVVDRDHVGMVEARGEARLPLRALEVGRRRAGHHADPLERDLAPEHRVATEPDRAHATAPDLSTALVPASDQRPSSRPRVSGRTSA